MDTCTRTRKILLGWDAFKILVPMIYYGTDGIPNDATVESEKAVKHAQSCIKCKCWLREQSDPEAMERMGKIQNYCCVMMFSAVEEAVSNEELKISYTSSFQGQPVWFAEVPDRVVGGGNLISYCPWCGSKLPDKPFSDRGEHP